MVFFLHSLSLLRATEQWLHPSKTTALLAGPSSRVLPLPLPDLGVRGFPLLTHLDALVPLVESLHAAHSLCESPGALDPAGCDSVPF